MQERLQGNEGMSCWDAQPQLSCVPGCLGAPFYPLAITQQAELWGDPGFCSSLSEFLQAPDSRGTCSG